MQEITKLLQGMRTEHFVDGKYMRAISNEYRMLRNPADNEAFATVAMGGMLDIDRAVAAARRAYDMGPWPRMKTSERARILKCMAQLIKERAEFLGTVESLNVGKLLKECINHEVPRAAENLEFFADLVSQELVEIYRKPKPIQFLDRSVKIESIVTREPVGVCGIIIPWNSPLLLGTWKFAPCLAMGNTCVLKPSPWAPLSLLQLGDIANEAGLPKGVLNIVPGEKGAGVTLVGHNGVSRISFTGGVETGEAVNKLNAQVRLAPPALELGGKAPNIVFSDCDFDFTVQGVARSIFRSQGQSCVAGSRLVLAGEIYPKFMEGLIAYVRGMKIGNQFDPDTQIGPLITRAHLKRVEDYILSGVNEGARLRYGGNRPVDLRAGNFLEPTIFDRIDPKMKIWREEIFGPVLTVQLFPYVKRSLRGEDYERGAIKMANDTKYGLSGNIWTKDLEKALRIAAELDTAMIWINGHFLRDLRAPFGGRKQSGAGSEGGRYSLEFFSQPKMVCIAQS